MKQHFGTDAIPRIGGGGDGSPSLDGSSGGSSRFVGPRARRWISAVAVAVGLSSGGGIALGYYGTDDFWVAGYCPKQPVEFSHRLHTGELGVDCLFCHFGAERGAMAGLPSLGVCMSCHEKVLSDSVKLLPIRASFAEGKPLAWVRVCKLPEFTYFDHSIHLSARLSCATCHGPIERMQRTEQVLAHTMKFCVDCHRDPKSRLPEAFGRAAPDSNFAAAENDPELGPRNLRQRVLSPPTHCSGCHR